MAPAGSSRDQSCGRMNQVNEGGQLAHGDGELPSETPAVPTSFSQLEQFHGVGQENETSVQSIPSSDPPGDATLISPAEVTPASSRTQQRRGTVELVDDVDCPPAPFDLEEICFADAEKKLSASLTAKATPTLTRAHRRGTIEQVDDVDSPPVPFELEENSLSSGGNAKMKQNDATIKGHDRKNLKPRNEKRTPGQVEAIADATATNRARHPSRFLSLLDSSTSAQPRARLAARSLSLPDPHDSAQSLSHSISPQIFHEVEATLVTPEPPSPVYNAVIVPQGDSDGNTLQPEPFWKRRLVLVGGGTSLLILALVTTIGVLVSTRSGRDGEENYDSSAYYGDPISVDTPVDEESFAVVKSVPTLSPTSSPAYLYCWGNPKYFGEDSDDSFTVPVLIHESVLDASAGFDYSVIVLTNGTACSAGWIEGIDWYYGWLGVLDATEGTNPFRCISKVFDTETGTTIDAPPFKRVFAGRYHYLLVDVFDRVWSTGNNEVGQLCHGDKENRMIPHKVAIEGKIVDAAVGGYHTLLLHENGTVFGCGSNGNGRLGLSDVSSVTQPTKIEGMGFVESVSAGEERSLFLSSDGAYATGYNSHAQLCVDTGGNDVKTPLILNDINRVEVFSFQAGDDASYILFQDGTVTSCGLNTWGQLGDGTNEDKARARTLTPNPIKQLGVGPLASSAFFVDLKGIVYATGNNLWGQLGIMGDQSNENVPQVVQLADAVVMHISAGWSHTLAIVKRENQ